MSLCNLTGGCSGDDRGEICPCQAVENETVASDECGLELVVLLKKDIMTHDIENNFANQHDILTSIPSLKAS